MNKIHLQYSIKCLACQGGNNMKESNQNMGWCRLSFELMKDSNLTDKDILLYSIMLDCCDAELTCIISQKEIT